MPPKWLNKESRIIPKLMFETLHAVISALIPLCSCFQVENANTLHCSVFKTGKTLSYYDIPVLLWNGASLLNPSPSKNMFYSV